jgi:amino acid transporter
VVKKTSENISIKKHEQSSRLKTLDLFFLSFGGQAPFISLLTFGTVMISIVGTAAAFAMIVATFVVLLNGLVIYFLSLRYKRGGGYYVYALYSLTPRLGLNTGWIYLIYALSYGGTLLAGGAYVMYTTLTTIFSTLPSFLTQWSLALILSLLASVLVISGISVSARYARIMSLVEIFAILFLSIIFLYDSGWKFYNPVPNSITTTLLSAVVFGLGIPTGYGSIAPLGKEAKSTDIGRAAIAVLLFGGAIATFFFYSLGALGFTGNLIDYLLTRFGIIGLLVMSFIALNDGTLGGMAYILADSRTFSAMAEDGVFPRLFKKEVKGKPLYAEIFIAIIFISALTTMTYFMGLLNAFTILGALAGLYNLFIHTSANLSLIRVASKRAKKHVHEIAVGVLATLVSLGVFFYSLPSFEKYIVYLFLGWIILGFFYAEALEIVRASEE